ncbi:MAG: hypothetical protein HY985_15755 [Magnetospirillum sp.]|nr:hypothetical protein [Magnetospirillum sp.]
MKGSIVGRLGRRGSLRLLMLVAIVLPVGVLALYGVKSYGEALEQSAAKARRNAAVIAEYTARVIGGHALLIDLVEERLARLPPGGLSSAVLDDILAGHKPLQDLTVAIVVMDSTGVVHANTLDPRLQGRNFGDRDYFVQARGADAEVITKQVSGRITGQPFFSLSRRFSGGVIVIAIYCRAFEQVFGALAASDRSPEMVALFLGDGHQLARYPSLPEPVVLTRDEPGLMQYVPEQSAGLYRVFPKTGAGEHLFAFQKVSGYPLWVTYGVKIATIRSVWLRDMAVAGAVAVLTAWLLVALAKHSDSLSAAQEAVLQRLVAARTVEAEQRAAEAERADRAKSVFLAAASHDLRQPIQALRLVIDLLDQRLADAADRRVLAIATKAVEAVEELLAAILDLSVLDSGIARAHPRPLALGPLLAGLGEELAVQAERRGIRFRAGACSAWVVTDPPLLARILRNLLANALRYTDRGRIVLGCRRVGATAIRIEVWDTGAGIPADKLDAVFEDFVQLDNPERDRAKGLGLGLAVARRTAALLGHDIGVRSQPGRGTVFWVTAPRCDPPAEACPT